MKVECTFGTNFDKVRQLCNQNNIPLKHPPQPKVLKGWNRQPKGMLQVLWERGFIDTERLQSYTINGKKDSYGLVDKTYALNYIMSNTVDFQNEESLLQTNGRKLGVLIDRSPKCHCEVAGEGIEYSWGFAKNRYRRLPLKEKRKKEEFRRLVRDCLSRNYITTNIVRRFSKRARDYMCAYQTLKDKSRDDNSENTNNHKPALVKIEKMCRDFKTRRSALDFDSTFIHTSIVTIDDDEE